MELTINGKNEAADFTTMAALLSSRELDASRVVVELNGKILPRDDYATAKLADGDVVEIVQFVAGG